MEGLLHQIVAGLVSGGTYALLALSLVMITRGPITSILPRARWLPSALLSHGR